MESKNSYFITGASFIIALVGLVTFVLFMTANHERYDEIYYIKTTYLPNGVRKNSPVLVSGVPAGLVRETFFSDNNQSTIAIKVAIAEGFQISKDSKAEVITNLLSGGATINITRGSGVGFGPNEDRVIEIIDYVESVSEKASQIIDSTKTMLDKINFMLGDENKTGLTHASRELITDENIKKLNDFVNNLDIFSQSLAKLDIAKLYNESLALSANLKSAAKNFEELNAELLVRVKNGEFDFKEILSQSASELDYTTKSLRRTLGALNDTLYRLEKNPYEFFFKDTKE